MKTAWVKDDVRENLAAAVMKYPTLSDIESIVSEFIRNIMTPVKIPTIDVNASAILRLRTARPKTLFLRFLSRQVTMIWMTLAMKPSDPVNVYMYPWILSKPILKSDASCRIANPSELESLQRWFSITIRNKVTCLKRLFYCIRVDKWSRGLWRDNLSKSTLKQGGAANVVGLGTSYYFLSWFGTKLAQIRIQFLW